MTIIYQYRVATTSLGGFLKLLRAWKGSVYKLLYKELIIFVILYAVISLIYRLALDPGQQRMFEAIVVELHGVSSAIPLSFVLGFYVTFIVQRWWQQFTNVPWPDRTLFIMTTYLHGFDDRARMQRRAVARYMLFGLIFIMRAVSVAVMKRFPTVDHIVDAGFITKEEAAVFEATQCKYQKFFVPLMWANNVLVTARREGKIESDFGLRMIIQQLADFRDKCSLCFVYDWITVPLVYTQVVTFAVYSYFAVCLFGQQYLDPRQNLKGFEGDFYVPGFTILQFLFYMGWLKVAEQMINPFGEDDDDYDINWLLDRHTAVAFALVDQCYGKHPGLVKDQFWNDVAPDVPYTESSARSIRPNFLGSTFNIARPSLDHERMLIREHDDINQGAWPTRPRGKGSMTESLLSLFPFRHLRSGIGDSMATLESTGSGHGRFMSVPNGRAYYHMISKNEDDDDGRVRRVSVDLPVTPGGGNDDGDGDDSYQLRERSSTDADFKEIMEDKERKLSLPFSIHLFSKNKQKKLDPQPTTVSSPKLSRFSVEPVTDAALSDGESGSGSKTRRSGHVNVLFQNNDKVSRPTALSAIEEGSTITSIKQLMMPGLSDESVDNNASKDDNDDDKSSRRVNDVFDENEENQEEIIDEGDGKGGDDEENNTSSAKHGHVTKSVTFEDPLTTSVTNTTPSVTNNISGSGAADTPTTSTISTDAVIEVPSLRKLSSSSSSSSPTTTTTAETVTTVTTNDNLTNGVASSPLLEEKPKDAATAATTSDLSPLIPPPTSELVTIPKIIVTRSLSEGSGRDRSKYPSGNPRPKVTPFQEIDTKFAPRSSFKNRKSQ